MVALSCYDSLFGEKEGYGGIFAGKCVETLICGYLLVLRTKDIFWVQIVRKYENLCKGIKNMEKYKQTTLCIISAEEQLSQIKLNHKDNKPLEFETEQRARKWVIG
jgi:hypothetical protein